MINNLKRAGYGVVLVAHIKDKVFNKDTDTEYIKTVPDLTDRERNIISAMADFLLLGNFETEIVEPAKKNDEGKIIKEAVVKTKRVLYLRTNENTEAGFRWKNVPEKIPFDFKEFKKVFSEAVQEEIEHGKKKFGLSNDETNSIREKLDEIKQQEEREIFEQEKLQEIIQDIIATAKEKKNQNVDPNKINEIITLYGDIRKVQDIEKAKEVLEKLKSLS